MKTKSRFAHVHIAGEWEPPFHDPNLSLVSACERYAVQAKKIGATALQLNFITTPYHPLFYILNEEVYLFFGNYGASLDMFAESDYSKGLYPRFMLEENIRRLHLLGKATEKNNLKGLLYLCEPRFQHPDIFKRFPHWRGPRVDNPSHSTTPLFALDTDHPEVMKHYRQLLQKVLSAAPCLRYIVLFSQDSGSGFSHADYLYAGPNGPAYNRKKPVEERVIDFCEGLKIPPIEEVTVCSSFSPEEWQELQRTRREDIHGAVWGLHSWTGGLEDQWAWNQCGAERLSKIGFERARKERLGEFQSRIETVKSAGRKPRILSPAPNEHYFQLMYVPNPWEQLEILKRYEEWGAEQLFLRGNVTYDDEVSFNVNQSSCSRFLNTPGLSPEEAVQQTLTEWVVPPVVEPLTSALRAMEKAVRFRPNFSHCIDRNTPIFSGPLVPDQSKLTDAEKRYYWHVCLDTLIKIKGNYYWVPTLTPLEVQFIFDQFEKSTFPEIESALKYYQIARRAAKDDKKSQQCLNCQERYSKVYQCLQMSIKHFVEMLVYYRGLKEYVSIPTPEKIVESEIENTERWIELLGEHPEHYIRLSQFSGVMYSNTIQIVDHLKLRIEIMTNHKQDPVTQIRQG